MTIKALRRVKAPDDRNLRRREQRRELVVESWRGDGFCGVCHYLLPHCRCAGARLFLRSEVLRLRALLRTAALAPRAKGRKRKNLRF